MQALETYLKSLLSALPPAPADKATLDALVLKAIEDSKAQSNVSSETRKGQWEYLLRKEVLTLASTEGQARQDPKTTYYDDLRLLLDLLLTFTERDACDQTLPFSTLSDLFETQTIASCEDIFSWVEARAPRLTVGLTPQKGKALVLLRALNDLLRRLSKAGGGARFCGRILTFLSAVFPLGERSGVNLRGEYGPAWDGPGVHREGEHETMDAGAQEAKVVVEEKAEGAEDKMEVDEAKPEALKEEEAKRLEKEDFYRTFWSLQLPFSRPPLFADPATFPAFKEAVNKVFPVIKEATAKDRALMGSKNSGGAANSNPLKRKRDSPEMETNAGKDYFFAKYLSSPELLDLEIADTHFRRQFLFQLLIVLQHLLTFTKTAKAAWTTPRNRSLQMDFTLEPADATWAQETLTRATEELRQTAPGGRAFAETAATILERERNWVRWKNVLCTAFERGPWGGGETTLEEATREVRERMRAEPEPWPHKLGSEPLTEIWAMGYRDLRDLENSSGPGDIKDFIKRYKQEQARVEMRIQQLQKTAERQAQARAKAAEAQRAAAAAATAEAAAAASPTPKDAHPPLHPSLPAKPGSSPVPPLKELAASPAPAASPVLAPTPAPATPEPTKLVLPPDPLIQQYEDNKQRWAWLGLRIARHQYIDQLKSAGTGDLIKLEQSIKEAAAKAAEEARKAAEKKAKEEVARAAGQEPGADQEASPSVGTEGDSSAPAAEGGPSRTDEGAKEGEGADVKMDDQ